MYHCLIEHTTNKGGRHFSIATRKNPRIDAAGLRQVALHGLCVVAIECQEAAKIFQYLNPFDLIAIRGQPCV